MNTVTDIEQHLRKRPTGRSHRRRADDSPHTQGYPLTMIDWDELNTAIDELCAQFKAAQPEIRKVKFPL